MHETELISKANTPNIIKANNLGNATKNSDKKMHTIHSQNWNTFSSPTFIQCQSACPLRSRAYVEEEKVEERDKEREKKNKRQSPDHFRSQEKSILDTEENA